MSFKPLFSRALGLGPGRLHFAAHSHHLWPDVSFEAQQRAWVEANLNAHRKWDLLLGEIVPETQAHVARRLSLPSPDTIAIAPSTHDLLVRLASGVERKGRPLRVLTTDEEFHSARRQFDRWTESGEAEARRVPLFPFNDFAERFLAAAREGDFDLILVSHVFYRTGLIFDRFAEIADLSRPQGPWVVIDGYHGFMSIPTDLSAVHDRLFYLAGGYKYAMAGEGVCFLHAPEGFCPRPAITGWFAEHGATQGPPGVAYPRDAGRLLGATMDNTPLYRFNAVQKMLEDQNLSVRSLAEHARGLMLGAAEAIRAGAAGPLSQAEILNPPPSDLSTPHARFLALRHPEASGLRAALAARDVVVDVRGEVLRLGFGPYQDEADVARLIALCGEIPV